MRVELPTRHSPLALRMLMREWRSGELTLLFAALVLGVAMVAGISLFAERLQKALVGEASNYLGADRVLQLAEPMDATLQAAATQQGLHTARTALFPTMVYPADPHSERSALASLKAVSAAYPLRGELEIENARGERHNSAHGPASGEVWVDANILNQLDSQLGDKLEIGNLHFTISHVLTREGDAGSSFYGMGARVMMNDADLPATGLILPGSRVEYRYLFAGPDKVLDSYFADIKPQLPASSRLISLADNQPGIAGALDKAGLFLRLAGSLGVLLAALAAGFAARRYSERHSDTVAVMKTLGTTRRHILALLAGQLAALWLTACLFGLTLGSGLQYAFLWALADWVPTDLPAAGFAPYALGAITALVCLAMFVGPAFWRLAAVPPWQVLRQATPLDTLGHHWPALPGAALLVWLYSQHLALTGWLLAGLALLALPAVLCGWLMLGAGRRLSMQAGSAWRLGIANVLRHRTLSLLQVFVFGLTFMLLAVMVLLRGSLLAEWRMQIPADAPNVFLLNIAPGDVQHLQTDLQTQQLHTAALYPMVRGRLTGINGRIATELFDESVGEVYRELNLSWAAALPPDNVVVAGQWPGERMQDSVPVSVEQGLAKRLKLSLGDRLQFTIGEAPLQAHVASTRSLDWDRMTPNFYFLFPPGALDGFSATWMTSLHRSPAQEAPLTRLLRQYPSVSAFPVDDLIARIQAIVERASLAVEVILLLVLVAGVLVLLTCLRASLDQRLHESALLRTLGAGQRLILGSLAVEFLFLGFTAGLLAATGAEFCAWGLQTKLFKMDYTPHPWLWFGLPLLSALLIGAVGTAFCRHIVTVPPMASLRESAWQNT